MKNTGVVTTTYIIAISQKNFEILTRIAAENGILAKDVADYLIERGLKSSKYRDYVSKSSKKAIKTP